MVELLLLNVDISPENDVYVGTTVEFKVNRLVVQSFLLLGLYVICNSSVVIVNQKAQEVEYGILNIELKLIRWLITRLIRAGPCYYSCTKPVAS